MNLSKKILVSIVLLAFLAIGTVSAGDIDSETNIDTKNSGQMDLSIDNTAIVSHNTVPDSQNLNLEGKNVSTTTNVSTTNKSSSETNDKSNNNKVSTSQFSTNNVITITNSNYNTYFNNDGSIKSGINSGDTIIISGTLTNKKIRVSVPLNIIGTDTNGKFVNGTITIINTGSGTNVTGITFENRNQDGHGVHLTSTQNNKVENCTFTINGVNAYSIPIVNSHNNKIIGNIITQTQTSSSEERTHSLVVLGGSNYNIIHNNTLRSDGSNCIYLSTYSFADFSGSTLSHYNNISNNRIYGVNVSWCQGITVSGDNNLIKNNTITGAYMGIAVQGTNNNISYNNISAIDTAIQVSGNNIKVDNNLINVRDNTAGISVSASEATVTNNTISTEKGTAIYVNAANNIVVTDNNIITTSGKGINVHSSSEYINIINNNIKSNTGTCIELSRTSRTKFPKHVTLSQNRLETNNNSYAIDAKDSDPETVIGVDYSENTIVSGKVMAPEGGVITPPPEFNGNMYNITEDNFNQFFNDDGTLKSIIDDGDILNFIGNINNKDLIINKKVKITAKNSKFYNVTIKITESGVYVEKLDINNINKIGILIQEAINVTIINNNITIKHNLTAYGIYVYKSDGNSIISNRIRVTGDFLTFAILLYGSNENIIEKNILNINGTGQLYNNSGSTCIDGEICIDGDCIDGGICIDGGGAGIIPEIYRTYGIIILYSDDNKIMNNTINATSQLNRHINPNEGTNSIVGIDVYYDSNRNHILDNNITIIANDPYLYGIGVLGSPSMTNMSSAYDNVFKNNYIYIKGPYFATGFIAGQNSFKTIIDGNEINCIAGNYSYGITLESSQQSQISNNQIYCTGLVNYLIELYESNNNVINNNELKGNGSYTYGIAAYSSSNNKIYNNIISVEGTGSSLPIETNHRDIIPSGNAGILLLNNSNENSIYGNTISSSGEYAINITRSNNNVITDNKLESPNKKGQESIGNNGNSNSMKDNYFYEFVVNFPNTSTTVNGIAKFRPQISGTNSGNIKNTRIEFFILVNGVWKSIGTKIVSDNGYYDYSIKKLSSLKIGTYDVKAVFSNENFKDLTVYSKLTIGKAKTKIILNNFQVNRGKTSEIYAKVVDEHGNIVSGVIVEFYFNGVYMGSAKSDLKGIAKIKYPFDKKQPMKSYTLQAISTSTTNYLSTSTKSKITIKGTVKPQIKAKNQFSTKKRSITIRTTLSNIGPRAAKTVKIYYKLPKGLKVGVKSTKNGKVSYNARKNILTWSLSSVKVHKSNAARLTFVIKATRGIYSLKPIIRSSDIQLLTNNNMNKIRVK